MPVKRMREHLEQQVKFLTQLLPVLRPDQREKLAASMGKMHHPGGHDGMAPGMMAPGMMAPGMMWEDMNGEHG